MLYFKKTSNEKLFFQKNPKKTKTYNYHIITEKLHVQEIVQNNSNYVHTV